MIDADRQGQDGKPRAVNPLHIRVDWRAYWQAFKAEHGEPVVFEGRLLFRDGWTYSSTDIKGPEWPPPLMRGTSEIDKQELKRLQLAYWSLRRRLVEVELGWWREQVKAWRELQSVRSAGLPLTAMMLTEDENGRQRRVRWRGGMEAVEGMEAGKVEHLEAGLAECERMLSELTPKKKEHVDA